MALSGQSLNSASATGVGDAIMFDEPRPIVAQLTWSSAGPGAPTVAVAIEGTLDGVNWAQIQLWSTSNTGSIMLLASNSGMRVMGVRANLVAIQSLQTGASVSVSVFLSALEF